MVVRDSENGARFEVEVVKVDGVPYPEVQMPDFTYVVVAAGEVFEVRCRSLAPWPPFFIAELAINGQGVGYIRKGKSMSDYWSSFNGYRTQGGSDARYRCFQFARPERVVSARTSDRGDLNSSVGKMQVSVYQATRFKCVKGHCEKCKHGHHTNTGSPPCQVPEGGVVFQPSGKKFFKAPSITVRGGEELQGSRSSSPPAFHWRTTCWIPVLTVCFQFETADVLMLRGVLDAHDPGHLSLLPDRLREAYRGPIPGSPRARPEQQAGGQGTSVVANMPGTSRVRSLMQRANSENRISLPRLLKGKTICRDNKEEVIASNKSSLRRANLRIESQDDGPGGLAVAGLGAGASSSRQVAGNDGDVGGGHCVPQPRGPTKQRACRKRGVREIVLIALNDDDDDDSNMVDLTGDSDYDSDCRVINPRRKRRGFRILRSFVPQVVVPVESQESGGPTSSDCKGFQGLWPAKSQQHQTGRRCETVVDLTHDID